MLETGAGPGLRLVSSYPENGAGFDCDQADPACGVPLDANVELRFDRFLLPSTANRQSILIRTGNQSLIPRPGIRVELEPRYDVFERVVRFVLPEGTLLEARAAYTVELPIATSEDSFGFRAFDGAALTSDGADLTGEAPIRFTFRTGSSVAEPVPAPLSDCEATFCAVFGGLEPGCDLPLKSGCAAGGCHGEPYEDAPMGLVLASVDELARTALSRVAHGAETGPTTGAVAAASARFGVAMPVVDPGHAENSYLFYKLLLNPEAYLPNDDSEDLCTGTRYRAPVAPGACFAPPADELRRLSEWFVQGAPMPPSPSFVHRNEIRALQDFISAGATCSEND